MSDSTQFYRGTPDMGASAAGNGESHLEYECKLGGSAQALKAAKKAASALSDKRLTWSKDDLESVYFDTPDLRLGHRGVTFRVRRKKGGFIQCVKSDDAGTGAVFSRGEWEQPVAGLVPELDKLPKEAIECIGLVLPGELRETFRTRFTRERTVISRKPVMGPESLIEVAIDIGEVVAGQKRGAGAAGARPSGTGGARGGAAAREVIQECELELVQGDPRALFEVALELQQAAGLSIIQTSKAARGYRLLSAPAPVKPMKAEKTDLRPDQPVNDVITEILRAGTRQMLANEAPSIDGTDPEGVHQFRVAVRRMRSMLSVFSRLLDPARVDWLKAELKWIAGEFGPARDWDVFIAEIMGPPKEAGVEPAAMAALADAARARRQAAYVRVRDALASARYAGLVLKLSAFTETQGWAPQPCPPDHPLAQPISKWAPKLLKRAHKKTIRAGQGLADMDVPARHMLRIRLKKLRYNTDFLQGLYDTPEKKPYLKALGVLQDDFGHLNDVAVAETLLGELTADAPDGPARIAAAAILAWHTRGLRDSEPRLLKDWQKFTEAAPFWRAKK